MATNVQDQMFLARVMGVTPRLKRVDGDGGLPSERLGAWVAAAKANPQQRATGLAKIETLLDMLPTEEDAARVPVEVTKRNAHPVKDERVDDSRGEYLGWVTAGGRYAGLCPCESGRDLAKCHGAAAYSEQ